MKETISDELLAAYIDGNTSPIENLIVESSLEHDTALMETNDVLSDLNFFSSMDFSSDLMHDLGFGDLFSENITISTENFNEIMDPTGMTPDVQQQYPDTCAIKSQQLILNEYGIDVNEDQLVQFSYDHGWYNGDGTGTNAEDVGNLLESANIPVTRQADANVFNLVSELSQGHKVIVGVDSGELWDNKFMGWLNDFFNGDTPDHALIVAGIDTSDPNNVMVIVDDPGTGEYHKAYPLDQFMDAWSDSECYMVSTDIPVPDHSLAMTNFDYGQGHIPQVAGMSYDDFQIFNDLSYGLPASATIDGGFVSPTSSLMDAYFNVATHDLAFSDIFSDNFMFNDYLNTDVATSMMQQTYHDNLSEINFDEIPNGMDYSQIDSNQAYEDFLHNSIDYFNSVGDFDSAMLCQQQLMMVDYCESYDIDFCSTFFG